MSEDFEKTMHILIRNISGTKVELLAPRKLDDSSKGFTDWTFMSVMTWGENGEGLWILKISDHVSNLSDNILTSAINFLQSYSLLI